MNRLTVVGRIVRDVELREVGDGQVVLNNSLAIPRTYKTGNGQEADFINFVAWGKRAELIEEYCDKGNLVGFDGKIQSRNYQTEEGQTVYVVEMLVDSVHFLQSRNQSRRKKQQTRAPQTSPAQKQPPQQESHGQQTAPAAPS